MFKINYSVNGIKRWIGPDPIWWGKHWVKVAIAAIAVVAVFMLAGCSYGRSDTVPTQTVLACQGSYIGNYDPPSHEERIRLRNLSLTGRGMAITGDDAVDNKNAGGGDPDGGIWMGGSFKFETDAACNIIKSQTLIFYSYEYSINGQVASDGSFKLVWSGQGSAGEMFGKVNADSSISGEFHHPAPDNFVYGVLNGRFTPMGTI